MASSKATATSVASVLNQPLAGSALDFSLFFKATYPNDNTQNTTGGTYKRKSRGMVLYQCLHCPNNTPWSNRKRDNAWHHARRCHADAISHLNNVPINGSSEVADEEREVKRPQINAFFPSHPSNTSLRRIFDRNRYFDTIIGLVTRHRLAFSAITWDEMQEVILAANPTIKDLLLTSQDSLMRLIDATYDLYSSQLKAALKAATSKIHILSNL